MKLQHAGTKRNTFFQHGDSHNVGACNDAGILARMLALVGATEKRATNTYLRSPAHAAPHGPFAEAAAEPCVAAPSENTAASECIHGQETCASPLCSDKREDTP